MLEGVIVHKPGIITGHTGEVRHMLRADDALFSQFGEIYFSYIHTARAKDWKKRLGVTQHLAVVHGCIRLVLYDDRETSSTYGQIQELESGIHQYRLIRIPPGIWYAFGALNNETAIIANCTDLPHDPNDYLRRDLATADIPYSWS